MEADAGCSENSLSQAIELIKDTLRREPLLPFHKDQIYWPCNSGRLREILGMPEASQQEVREMVEDAAREVATVCPGLVVGAQQLDGAGEVCGIRLRLRPAGEWHEALRWAHGEGCGDPGKILSPPSAELLERTISGEFSAWRSELSVRHRIRFFGHHDFSVLIREIRFKRGVEITTETSEETYPPRKHFLRFRAGPVQEQAGDPGFNPVVDLPEGAWTPRRFARWFQEMLGRTGFTGREARTIWKICSREEFMRWFPGIGAVDSDRLAEMLQGVRGGRHFEVAFNLGQEAMVWTVEVRPNGTWEDMQEEIQVELGEPTPELEFGLSTEAASLYDWVKSLDVAALKFGLSPDVEGAIRDGRLAIGSWGKNLRAVIELLCEEVSERTGHRLRAVAWTEGWSEGMRIRVRKAACAQRALSQE